MNRPIDQRVAQITPGPWTFEVHELSEGFSAIVYDTRGRALADHLDEPTARLIAAAPKMLSLLVRYRNETPLGHQPHMIAHEADAVIAEVYGERS